MDLPRGSLDLGGPSPRCLVFLPGFACPPVAYRSFLAPVSLRLRVVVPEVGRLPEQVIGRSTPVEEAARVVELVDALRSDGSAVWLAGHSRGGAVAWQATPMAAPEGLVLVDPVSGGGPPWRRPEPPPAIEPRGPVCVIGLGVGGRCAPEGRNHEAFAEALPSARHVVVPACAHADVLDGRFGRLGRRLCGHGPTPQDAMRAARAEVLDALGAWGALGPGVR